MLTFLGIAACATPAVGSQARATGRDSAGIAIKEYSAAATAPEWHLAPEPVLSVGEGDFELYRVEYATWLDSTLVIANTGSSEIFLVDETGTAARRFGGKGEGPGEFRSIGYLDVLPPDSIITYDFRLGRFQVFDRDGELARTFSFEQMPEHPMYLAPVGLLPGRQIAARGLRSGSGSQGSGLSRDTFDLALYDLAGRPLGFIGSVPAWEAYNTRVNGVLYSNVPVPMGATTWLSVAGGHVVAAATGENEIRLFDSDGTISRIIRGAGAPGPAITNAEAAAIKRRIVEGSPDSERAETEALYRDMPIPERRPAIRAVDVSRDGLIWVTGWPADSTADAPVRIFDENGDLVAMARIPHRLRILAVEADRLVGVWKNDLGVESVRVYAVETR